MLAARTATYFLNYGESDDRVTRQATSDRQQDVRWLQVRAWHDRSYIAGIPLLAHGLTVKLSPCQCSLAGRIAACLCGHPKCKSSATRSGSPRMIQHLSSYGHTEYNSNRESEHAHRKNIASFPGSSRCGESLGTRLVKKYSNGAARSLLRMRSMFIPD